MASPDTIILLVVDYQDPVPLPRRLAYAPASYHLRGSSSVAAKVAICSPVAA